VELEERISLFWSIFVLDRYAGLVFPSRGVDSTSQEKAIGPEFGREWTMETGIRNEAVRTRWPRDAVDWESVSPLFSLSYVEHFLILIKIIYITIDAT